MKAGTLWGGRVFLCSLFIKTSVESNQKKERRVVIFKHKMQHMIIGNKYNTRLDSKLWNCCWATVINHHAVAWICEPNDCGPVASWVAAFLSKCARVCNTCHLFCASSDVSGSWNCGAQSQDPHRQPLHRGRDGAVHLQQRLRAVWEQPADLLQQGLSRSQVEREAPQVCP